MSSQWNISLRAKSQGSFQFLLFLSFSSQMQSPHCPWVWLATSGCPCPSAWALPPWARMPPYMPLPPTVTWFWGPTFKAAVSMVTGLSASWENFLLTALSLTVSPFCMGALLTFFQLWSYMWLQVPHPHLNMHALPSQLRFLLPVCRLFPVCFSFNSIYVLEETGPAYLGSASDSDPLCPPPSCFAPPNSLMSAFLMKGREEYKGEKELDEEEDLWFWNLNSFSSS